MRVIRAGINFLSEIKLFEDAARDLLGAAETIRNTATEAYGVTRDLARDSAEAAGEIPASLREAGYRAGELAVKEHFGTNDEGESNAPSTSAGLASAGLMEVRDRLAESLSGPLTKSAINTFGIIGITVDAAGNVISEMSDGDFTLEDQFQATGRVIGGTYGSVHGTKYGRAGGMPGAITGGIGGGAAGAFVGEGVFHAVYDYLVEQARRRAEDDNRHSDDINGGATPLSESNYSDAGAVY